ncbi:hypothetical protein [Microbacterium imperiale]|uniref:Uncharacterized protein n=1 Tax=Microbacterium imperiale TaxID=33884 RepID=A0A9W6HGT7_9MICO|nr:hypothetical protein [Microbacterium imperiale]MBP2422016.1 hypothetical protein [Microbacterium imperiale]MDS0200174.1 hypothetical protein [Microbacterium imperiale]BFE39324.1 hypothetical protein GCM10017544_02800 [Microbacterium imperiale]GLJ79810.1 hypothetical protein GCM10017586_14920 [Microbacterium imperiale]
MDEFEGWSLGSAVDDGHNHSIRDTRPVTSEEVRHVDAALRLIHWVTNGSRWNDVLEAWDAMPPPPATSPPKLALLNQSMFSMLRALTAFSEQLAIAPVEVSAIAHRVSLEDTSDWTGLSEGMRDRALVEPVPLVEITTRSVSIGQTQKIAVLTQAACEWLGLREVADQELDRVLQRFLSAAEAHQTCLLRVFSESISSAVVTVKRLAAEVGLGRPILLRLGEVKDGQRPIQMRDLSLDVLPLLSISLERASRAAPRQEPESDSKSAVIQPHTEPDDLRAVNIPMEEPSGRANHSEDDPVGPDPSTLEPDWSAIDPAGLFLAAMRLSLMTEQRWSAALSETVRDETIAADLQQWYALIAAEWSKLGSADDTVVITWPLATDEVARIRGDDARAPVMAYLAAIDRLSGTLRVLAEPSERQLVIENETASLSAWWSSGGFATVRDAAHLLLRTVQSIGASGQAGTGLGIPDHLQTPAAHLWLDCATRAIECGLPEAALMYASYAFDSWVDRDIPGRSPRRQAAVEQLIAALPRVQDVLNAAAKTAQPISVTSPLAITFVETLSIAMTANEIRLRAPDDPND